jgi:hypothetical protein
MAIAASWLTMAYGLLMAYNDRDGKLLMVY